ncbi:MAG: hypothetical protein KGQ70_03385, partial [Alphaproteobacteria bacterium]|nr:hypothetical protein [Alphaproteobacteria bacterium]
MTAVSGEKQALATRLSQETVRQLHKKFNDALEAKARKTLPQGAAGDAALLEALKSLQVEAVRKGVTLKADALAALAAAGTAAVDLQREKIESQVHARSSRWSLYRSPRFSARQERQIAAAAEKRSDDAQVEKAFNGEDRIYLRLDDATQVSETQKKIAACLASGGYRITDYNKGYATDAAGKQQFKIGKLLKDDAALYKAFVDDSDRGLSNLLMVISRDPMDIARMSTGRPWSSCMGSGGFNWRFVPRDIRKGSLVAYLVSEKDPDIVTPLSRILIKPFGSEKTGLLTAVARMVFGRKSAAAERIYVPYKPFGLRNPAFVAAVGDFAEKNLNAGKTGDFWLVSGLYPDRKSRHVV